MKKAEKLEFEQLKNVSGGSGPTDEDVTAGVRAYCGNCQRPCGGKELMTLL